jgi:hypothetical protein
MHVRREANFGTHTSIKAAVKHVINQVWIERIPSMCKLWCTYINKLSLNVSINKIVSAMPQFHPKLKCPFLLFLFVGSFVKKEEKRRPPLPSVAHHVPICIFFFFFSNLMRRQSLPSVARTTQKKKKQLLGNINASKVATKRQEISSICNSSYVRTLMRRHSHIPFD